MVSSREGETEDGNFVRPQPQHGLERRSLARFPGTAAAVGGEPVAFFALDFPRPPPASPGEGKAASGSGPPLCARGGGCAQGVLSHVQLPSRAPRPPAPESPRSACFGFLDCIWGRRKGAAVASGRQQEENARLASRGGHPSVHSFCAPLCAAAELHPCWCAPLGCLPGTEVGVASAAPARCTRARSEKRPPVASVLVGTARSPSTNRDITAAATVLGKMVQPRLPPRLQTWTACDCTGYCVPL